MIENENPQSKYRRMHINEWEEFTVSVFHFGLYVVYATIFGEGSIVSVDDP